MISEEEKLSEIDQTINQSLIKKSFENAEKNEPTKIIGFRDMIEESINIIFLHLKGKNHEFNCWKDQKVSLKYDLQDFNSRTSILELNSEVKADTLRKKVPIIFVLKRIQGTTIKYSYKSQDFEVSFEFIFKKEKNHYIPVDIILNFTNIPEDDQGKNVLSSEIAFNIASDILTTKNIPPTLLNKMAAKFRQSGHYLDMKLKHQSDNNKNNLEELITKPNIKNLDVKVSGIKLNPGEDRILMAILKILHLKSDKNEESSNYYLGNMPPKRNLYGESVTNYPVLKFRPAELYKEYKGENDYSGAEAQYIKQVLLNLQEKMFLIVYRRHRKDEKGNPVIDRIEEYQPLVKVLTYYEGISPEEDKFLEEGVNQEITDQKGEIIVVLNPIFTDQINTKFIDYPTDINKMTVIASGGARKVTDANIKIRDYLMRELSNKRYTTEINEDNLPKILGLDGYIKEGKKTKIKEITSKALKFAEDLGIAKKVEVTTGAKGQAKIKFTLNQDF